MKARRSLILAVLIFCGTAAAAAKAGPSRIVFTLTEDGIPSITKDGHQLLSGFGYYFVANCAGVTDPAERLYSIPDDMAEPQCTCACVPYVVTLVQTRKNRVHAKFTVGPLPLATSYDLVSIVLEQVVPGSVTRQLGARTPGSVYSVLGGKSEVRFGPGSSGKTFAVEEDIIVN